MKPKLCSIKVELTEPNLKNQIVNWAIENDYSLWHSDPWVEPFSNKRFQTFILNCEKAYVHFSLRWT